MKKTSVGIIFLTVVIDLIGFGLILPLIPIYSQNFHAKGWEIGVIMGSYSLMQFMFAPVWGRLSDRIGRRLELARRHHQIGPPRQCSRRRWIQHPGQQPAGDLRFGGRQRPDELDGLPRGL